MTTERWKDQLDRVRSMAVDKGETWDLSANDQAALKALLERFDAHEAEAKAPEAAAERAEPRGLLVHCGRCSKLLREPGALLFSAPDAEGRVRKWHVCVMCEPEFMPPRSVVG